jgi:hypothetical protein
LSAQNLSYHHVQELKYTLSYITFHLLLLVKVKGRNVFDCHLAHLAVSCAGHIELTLFQKLHSENPNFLISKARNKFTDKPFNRLVGAPDTLHVVFRL